MVLGEICESGDLRFESFGGVVFGGFGGPGGTPCFGVFLGVFEALGF